MTGKRFALEYDGNCYKCIVDCNNGTLYTDRKQIVEVLNKLHETNEQLQHDATILVQSNQDYRRENEQLKQSVNNLKDTIIKITIAYQRKYDRTIVDLVDEIHEEDITDLIKELRE